ncbi:MAG TPA: hypothetical protein PKC43_14620 [Phycisphaerales bacterium]|nr:hypothetical protein [Phycisphaerales bacterium]HMP38668.1 hypothetical protein [Phycisphaerales bacterium]
MNLGRTAVVAVAAGAALVVAAWVVTGFRTGPGTTPSDGRAALLPELAARGDSVDRIEVERGGRRMVLARSGDGWVSADQAEYPVDPQKVVEILAKLARLQRGEPMTALPARHGELGLAWPDEQGDATLVRILAGGDVLSEIVLGQTRFAPPTTFARRLGEDQTWRCPAEVALDANAIILMSPVLLDLPAAPIALIEVERRLGAVVPNETTGMGGTSGTDGTDAGAASVVIDDEASTIPPAAAARPATIALLRDEDDATWRVEGLGGGLDDPDRSAELQRIVPELFGRLEFEAIRWTVDPPETPEVVLRAQIGDRAVAIELLPEERTAATAGALESGWPQPSAGRWFRVVVGDPQPGLGAVALTLDTNARLDAAGRRTAGREFRMAPWRAARLIRALGG